MKEMEQIKLFLVAKEWGCDVSFFPPFIICDTILQFFKVSCISTTVDESCPPHLQTSK